MITSCSLSLAEYCIWGKILLHPQGQWPQPSFCHAGRTWRAEPHRIFTRTLQAIPEVGFPLRALVIRSPPVCVSSSLPPLPIAVCPCKMFIPSKAIMLQIILPLLGFCLGFFPSLAPCVYFTHHSHRSTWCCHRTSSSLICLPVTFLDGRPLHSSHGSWLWGGKGSCRDI